MDVLTSWAPISLKDYALDINKFGKCNVYPMGVLLGGSGMGEGTASVPTSGNCVSGGSTGYSVKMVHSEYLKRNHQDLGGSGQNGSILNPPPDVPDPTVEQPELQEPQEPTDFTNEPFLLIASVFLDNSVEAEMQKHFPFLNQRLSI
jgi:hypothetical protein